MTICQKPRTLTDYTRWADEIFTFFEYFVLIVKMAEIRDLPFEVLAKIFSFLDVEDLLNVEKSDLSASNVLKDFRLWDKIVRKKFQRSKVWRRFRLKSRDKA